MIKSFTEFLDDKGLGDEGGMTMQPETPAVQDDEVFDTLKELVVRVAANKDAYRDFIHFISSRREYDSTINNLVDLLPKESSASLRSAARKSLVKKSEDEPKAPKDFGQDIVPNMADTAPNPYN